MFSTRRATRCRVGLGVASVICLAAGVVPDTNATLVSTSPEVPSMGFESAGARSPVPEAPPLSLPDDTTDIGAPDLGPTAAVEPSGDEVLGLVVTAVPARSPSAAAEPQPSTAPAESAATVSAVPTTAQPAVTPAPALATPAAALAEPTETPTPQLATPTPTLPAVATSTVSSAAPVALATAPAPRVEVADHVGRGEAALARLPHGPGAVGFTISFHPGRDGFKGLTYHDRRHIEIFVRSTMSDAELLYVIAHEVGHAYDLARITLDDEARWRAARGIPAATPWWPGPSSPDLATPAGDFAECFAAWSIGSASHSAFGSCSGTGQLVADIALK